MAGLAGRFGSVVPAALLAAFLVTATLVTAGPARAQGQAPAQPVLVGPAAGATQVPPGQQLQVKVSDPDDTSLNVSFYGRPSGTGAPNTAPDFTFAVIPDTQNYTSAAAYRPIMGQQTQWLVDNRQRLNTAFVTQLGDLVGIETTAVQWQAASQYMATLDAAGVPNTVLPGNHDINLTTGEAALYRQYFPVSRYAGASWNSATASYGGYLGQNQFSPDPVDRQNMDNYALFTAGGMDFLLLNLEFNPPDYVIDWAKRVLAAFPNRRAIVATHSYVDYAGRLSTQVDRLDGGNSPAQLWQKLISPSCSIFMVVNGHFHNGDLSEARRTDTNACGHPVQEVLSDYQERSNGGNGWLRYYTFKPASNQIQAVTYSPYLNQYETDADSAFTLPYDMRTPPAFTKIGQTTVASGGTASVPTPPLPVDTGYEWYATVTDGTSTTTSPTWAFTTASAGGPVLAKDGFSRTATGGWGSAETGGAWTVTGGASRFAVTGGDGVTTTPAGVTATATLAGVGSTASDTSVQLRLDSIPDAVTHLLLAGRRVGASTYAVKARIAAGGAVDLRVARDGTDLTSGIPLGVTLAAGQRLAVRIQVEGTAPTAIRARAWKVGTTEPTGWSVSATDSTAALQAAGGVGISAYLSSTATTGPAVVRWDELLATPIGSTQPPVTPAPTTPAPTTPAPTTPAPTTPAPTTPAPSPTAPPVTVIATDGFGRTVANGWGPADTGGAWTVQGAAGSSSVGGGQGVQKVASGATTTATLTGVSSSSTDLVTQLSAENLPNGPVYVSVVGRLIGTADYSARAKLMPTGEVAFTLTRSGTTLATGALGGAALTAGEKLLLRVQVQGTSPTTVRARIWRAGTTEPSAWGLSVTDATAGLQAPGSVRLSTYLSSSATGGPVTVRFDDLRAARPE